MRTSRRSLGDVSSPNSPVLARHPTEPQCSYDPVEGLTLAPETDPMEKIRLLEDQISKSSRIYLKGCHFTPITRTAHLKGKLYEQRDATSRSLSPGQHPPHNHAYLRPSSAASSSGAGEQTPDVSGSMGRASLERLPASENSPDLRFRGSTHSPELHTVSPKDSSDPFMALLFSGWNPDLPDPPVLDHLYVLIRGCISIL